MDFFKSKKKRLFIILIIISIIIGGLTYVLRSNAYFSNSLSFIVIPIQRTFTSISNWTGEQINYLSNKNYLKETNEELFWENEKLKSDVNRLKQLEQENIRLSDLLETQHRYPTLDTVPATIIASDSNYWYETFIIDTGSSDGIEVNMVVLCNGGLVGRITEVGFNYSKVTSILDEVNSVSVKSLRTEDLGILKGSNELIGNKLAVVDYLALDSKVVVGDEIVTSHLSDIYPSNIVVGTITNIYVNEDNLTKSAVVEPIVDFSKLYKVLIVKDSKDTSFLNESYGE